MAQFSLLCWRRVFLDPRFRRPCQKSEDIVKFFNRRGRSRKSRGILCRHRGGVQKQDQGKRCAGRKIQPRHADQFRTGFAELDSTRGLNSTSSPSAERTAAEHVQLRRRRLTPTPPARCTTTKACRNGARDSVAAFLTASGIDPARINAIGMGEKNPPSPNPYDPVTAVWKCG